MQRLPKRLIDGSQIAGAATLYYTVPANTICTISACTLTNTTAGAVTASIYLVPSAGTAVASNCILSLRTIAAGESYNVVQAIGQTMPSGGAVWALAGAGASISIVASGYETNP